jgi:NAD(P)-dependent dehydrogenase (short-subunit alcohol dehydrogenase family)
MPTKTSVLPRPRGKPDEEWDEAESRVCPEWGGSLAYHRVDVEDTENLEVIDEVAHEHNRLDGVIAAAGVQQITPATEYTAKDVNKMMNINYTFGRSDWLCPLVSSKNGRLPLRQQG